MLDLLLAQDTDTLTRVALMITAGVAATTLVLFIYTLGLRAATILGDKRRRRIIDRWQGVLAATCVSLESVATAPLPKLRRNERTDLLEVWNAMRDLVNGAAARNLIELGKRLGLGKIARKRFASRRLATRLLAIQTLGHLSDDSRWGEMRDLLEHPNMALSVSSASAMADIDSERAIDPLLIAITNRRDWPRTKVSAILLRLGCDQITQPLCEAIEQSDNNGKAYLLQFAQLAAAENIDNLATRLLRESNDPRVLASALKLISGRHGVPRIALLTRHKTAFVRMQAAKTLGRLGQPEHLSLLESLLSDQEWWVRYRCAQAIVALPFMGPNAVRKIRDQQTDRYARDIMQQVMAEARLA